MALIKNNKAIVKDVTRVAVAVVGALEVATNSWLAKGHTFGANKETVLGIIGTAAFPAIATLAKYLDKKDPAFGIATDAAAAEAVKKISQATGASA